MSPFEEAEPQPRNTFNNEIAGDTHQLVNIGHLAGNLYVDTTATKRLGRAYTGDDSADISRSDDLTAFSTTFPEWDTPQIPRDNIVTLVRDQFSSEQRVLIINGVTDSGKTTLLSQFVLFNKDRCFSYFLGNSYSRTNPRPFLQDLCEQMAAFLGKRVEEIDELDTDRLTNLYTGYIRRVAQEAKRERRPVYFVIDSLDSLRKNEHTPSVLDLIPYDPQSFVYVLGSKVPDFDVRFKHTSQPMLFFSPTESVQYLSDLGFSEDFSKLIHHHCGGMPGYLSALRHQISRGFPKPTCIDDLPKDVNGLLDREWNKIEPLDESMLLVLSLIAFSKEPLTVPQLINASELTSDVVAEKLRAITFITQDTRDSTVVFISEAFKAYVREKLPSKQDQAEDLLIKYYSREPNAGDALLLLPAYLNKPQYYDRLKSLITPERFIGSLKRTKDLTVLQDLIRVAANMAEKVEDWKALPRLALMSSVLSELSLSPVNQEEVEALLDLGDYGEALQIANNAVLPEDRLQLLARVCSRRVQAGLSLPDNVLADLEQMAETVSGANLKDRVIDVAAALFDLLPQVAINLLERCVDRTSEERALDLARTVLTLRLESEPDDKKASAQLVRERIHDKFLKEFIQTVSPRIQKLSADDMLVETAKLSSTSGKMFQFIAWCRVNKSERLIYRVVEAALDTITKDSAYGVGVGLLGELADSVKSCDFLEVKPLVERIDLLKETSLKNPADEAVRLEMVLAGIEVSHGFGLGLDRVIQCYFDINEIQELDIRCNCYARLLSNLKSVDPGDSLRIFNEVNDFLGANINELLGTSALQLDLTRQLIETLSGFDPRMAFDVAQKLNTAARREGGFETVLVSYLERDQSAVDLGFIDDVWNAFKSSESKEKALVKALKHIASSGGLSKFGGGQRFIQLIEEMQSASNQCYAWSYFAVACCDAKDEDSADKAVAAVARSIKNVDSDWGKVSLAYESVSILASKMPEKARELFVGARALALTSPLTSVTSVSSYVNCLVLAMRAMSGLLVANKDHSEAITQLSTLINLVPSPLLRCRLFAILASRCDIAECKEHFEQVVTNSVLPALEAANDKDNEQDCLVQIMPVLYKFNPALAFRYMDSLDVDRRDQALWHSLWFYLSGAALDDPIKESELRRSIAYSETLHACELIERMETDNVIWGAVSALVDLLLVPKPSSPLEEIPGILIEREALTVAKRLEAIIDAKLPDQRNIQHTGFKVAALAQITRLRASAINRAQRNQIDWQKLAKEAKALPNIADRALVLADVGKSAYKHDPELAKQLLRTAERTAREIPNLADKAERFFYICEVWKDIDQREEAKLRLREAMTLAQLSNSPKSRDQLTGRILELAHNVSPELASTLTPLVDNPHQEHLRRMQFDINGLTSNSKRLEDVQSSDETEYHDILAKASWRMLTSLNSGSGLVRSDKEVGLWVTKMLQADISASYQVVAWAIKNFQMSSKRPSVSSALFSEILQTLDVCHKTSTLLLQLSGGQASILNAALPDNLLSFQVRVEGSGQSSAQEWIQRNVDGYLTLYDPFFSVGDLKLLEGLKEDTRVTVITSWKSHGVDPGDSIRLEQAVKSQLSQLDARIAVNIQIYAIGTASGESPVYSRYAISASGALAFEERDTPLYKASYSELTASETRQIEEQFVNPVFMPQFTQYKGERLIPHNFWVRKTD